MKRKLIFLALLLIFSNNSFGDSGNIFHKLYRPVPPEKAHLIKGQATQSEIDSKKINILIWNIKKTEKDAWPSEFIEYSQNKDLILLQEYFDGEIFNSTFSKLPDMRYDMAASFSYLMKNNATTGTLIASKTSPVFAKAFQSPNTEPIGGTPKTIICTKYPIAGTLNTLLVISIHGINFASDEAFKNQIETMRSIITDHDGPLIFAGDFNTRNKERTLYLEQFANELSLNQVDFFNHEERMKVPGTDYYLDHAFIRDLKVSHAYVIGSSKGSDHKPLVLRVAL